MKRRDFLKAAAPATVLPFLVGGFSMKAFADNSFLHSLVQSGDSSDRVFVLIQLIGGNDGLQTIIPLDQYDAIMKARANIAIPAKDVLKISDTVGFHPNMSGMKNLFTDGKIGIVQNVGYPEPNFSHFRSIDIWLTGADYDQVLQTGWLGRFLDQEYPGFPTGYPNAKMPDPIAIQIGSAVTLSLQGSDHNLGMAFSDPASFTNIINDTITPTPNTRAGHELGYIRSIGQQLQSFSTPVKNAASKGKTLSTKWTASGENTLADQLRIVAQLVAGGLKTKIYVVNLGGFDSHNDQRRDQDPLLAKLSSAISAFQDELKLNALEDRVVGMTFSEFGRRIASNSSGGTDHGTAAPLFVFGSKVIPGILGKNPVLPADATVEDNIAMEFDFRSIYTSVLKQWFASSDSEITNTMLKQYPTVPIIQQQSNGVLSQTPFTTTQLLQNYPNPCGSKTQITFRTTGGFTTLQIFDAKGNAVRTLIDEAVAPGEQTVILNSGSLPSGNYFYRLESGGMMLTKTMMVLK